MGILLNGLKPKGQLVDHKMDKPSEKELKRLDDFTLSIFSALLSNSANKTISIQEARKGSLVLAKDLIKDIDESVNK